MKIKKKKCEKKFAETIDKEIIGKRKTKPSTEEKKKKKKRRKPTINNKIHSFMRRA